jgi:3-isopropylmalate/(R)-2-methylmalate dehydratase small subunit
MEKIVGRVLKFGDNINTTIMAPSETHGNRPTKEVTMTAIRPSFPNEVKPGDVIVAGTNWGYGSHRESATNVFMELGVKAIVADSVARIYFRTCIALGMPVFSCNGVSKIFKERDNIELDIASGKIKNLTSGQEISGKPMPPFLLDLLEKGGLVPIIVEKNR